jgi:Protein of unknown function (DUF3037)
MAILHQLEFFLLRYAGDANKGESINLGVVGIAPDHGSAGFADVRFTKNWRRLHCFDPLLNTEELDAMEWEIRQDLRDPQRRSELLKRAGDAWSNMIQFDRLQGCLTESPAMELETLSSIYLETPTGTEKRQISGRQRIVTYIKDELEAAGVLPFMVRDIPVAEFTVPGDPMKLDFGYPAEGAFKFLHAVSLTQRVELGTLLAERFPKIASGLQAKKNVKAWLTAVVDDDLDRSREEVKFALKRMQENGMVVVPAQKMQEVAQGIRLEMKF